jgi:hypothetical protein
MKSPSAVLIATILATSALAADQPSDRVYTITLGPRTACATPMTSRQARAEGGFTDVTTPSSNVLAMAMSGSVAANAFLGHTSSATMTFHLEQGFEIECSDSATCFVRLTLESALVGFVRSKYKAGAGVKVASAKILVPGSPVETPLIVVHPPQCVEGDNGRLCNQHLPLIRVDKMPLGKYVLVADFVITCDAGGLTDGHSAADFSPSTSLPTDWVRTRDPFQGVDKKDFGFKLVLTADPPEPKKPGAMSAKTKDTKVAKVSTANLVTTRTPPTPTRPRPSPTGLDRHCGDR